MSYIIIGFAILCILWALSPNSPDHTYHATFGNESEHVSRFNHGVAVTGNKAITREQSTRGVALFGPTGSGKTTSVIISSAVSLSRGKSSMIFNSVAGDDYQYTSGYLAKDSYKIIKVDFTNSKFSESFNPLLSCKTVADIQKVSLLIARNSSDGPKSDPFWEQSAIMLLSLFIRYVVFHASPEFQTLQNVLRLIEKFAVDTDQTIDKMFLATNDEELMSAYKATLVTGDKALQGIISTVRTYLSLWNDKEVCRTTSANTIDFNILREGPVAIFLVNPLRDLHYLRPITALFFQSLFNFTMSIIPRSDENYIFFLLDEFAVYRFPALSITVSNIRKYRAGMVLCMQDEMALNINYSQAEAHQIKTNCGCQIYLPGQPLHTCKELSQILGKYTYTDEDRPGVERVRELMTPDEIRMSDKAIIIINNSPALKCKMVPFYNNIWLHHLSNLPPYPFKSTTMNEPPLIPFDK